MIILLGEDITWILDWLKSIEVSTAPVTGRGL